MWRRTTFIVLSPSSLETAIAAAHAAADKKAEDIRILDLQGLSSFADYFVICSGKSDPQLKAIVSAVRSALRENPRVAPQAVDGLPGSQWMVIDYGDVLVHVMQTERRAFYALDDLWSDAPLVEWNEA